MTRITLDPAKLALFQAAQGKVILCDEHDQPVMVVDVSPFPDFEPILTAEERKRRREEPGAMTTAELVAHLKQLGPS